jgi:protein-tyrosine phosphatase
VTETSATSPERHIRLPGTRNLRDVGGYPAGAGRRTRWRTLMRTDALDRLPPSSQQELLALGLKQVIDLRWPEELAEAPSVFATTGAVRYTNIPLLADDPGPNANLIGIYRRVFDERAGELATIVRVLLAPGGVPAVIGCAAGKDRTGVTIALLLATVGVPHDVIAEDYALSRELFAMAVDDAHLIDWRAEPADLEAPPEYILAALQHLDHRHGGPAALLAAHGMSDGEIDRLREVLTEPDDGA